jgi:hypothetical protein
MATPRKSNIDHEVAAVEEGHRAFVNPDGSIRVVSETVPGQHYTVRFENVRGLVGFSCDHPIVLGWGTAPVQAAPGKVPCKHAALAARRLEREDLALFHYASGEWLALGARYVHA